MDYYPYNNKNIVAQDGDLVVIAHSSLGHLCGYCQFDSADIPSDWHGNYDASGLQFLAVHGGLTYASTDEGNCVFGFDCAHAGDEDNPKLRNPEHVLQLTRQMFDQMSAFNERWSEYCEADREEKASILEEIRASADHEAEFGCGANIEMLSGAPSLGPEPKVAS